MSLKLGSLSPLGPRSAPCVGCATRPPSNKGKQVRRWGWVISLISKSRVTAWRVIKGKGSLFWRRQGQNSAQESNSLFRADGFSRLFQSPCYREAQQGGPWSVVLWCMHKSPRHPPRSLFFPPWLWRIGTLGLRETIPSTRPPFLSTQSQCTSKVGTTWVTPRTKGNGA